MHFYRDLEPQVMEHLRSGEKMGKEEERAAKRTAKAMLAHIAQHEADVKKEKKARLKEEKKKKAFGVKKGH